ncbi:MAG: transposase, partial [Terriglobia bacterium]
QSPGEWEEVWARWGKRMTAKLEPDSASVVDDTGLPKQGDDSVGVDRQDSGTLAKTGSCQVAVSLHPVGEQGNAVLGWRLYLPETGIQDAARRQAGGIPEAVVFKKKWELALDLIDPVRGWGPVADRIVLADAEYREATGFRDALEQRNLRYVEQTAQDPSAGIPRARHPAEELGLRRSTAEFSKRSGVEGQGLEEGSLAGGSAGLAGVTLPGDAGTTLPRIRPWRSTA